MHKARVVRLKDGTELKGHRVIDSDGSLLVFMDDDEGKQFIRLVPWNNVQFIDYDDPQAVEHVKAVAMMAMLETMDDIDESLEEIEELEQVLTATPQPEGERTDNVEQSSELTKNPYGE